MSAKRLWNACKQCYCETNDNAEKLNGEGERDRTGQQQIAVDLTFGQRGQTWVHGLRFHSPASTLLGLQLTDRQAPVRVRLMLELKRGRVANGASMEKTEGGKKATRGW
ncbi:unnamed protein product [Citrullus colocynthis]|uniref:Uncharacterized protein n=1 Tax=Citrullus colocynthis TaxID=252529 RepID=A0ABP0YHN6_9ROSI